MGIYEKAVKKIETIEKEHADRIRKLKEDLNRLQGAIDEADHQRREAMQTGNQKLYSASVFALDQAKTEHSRTEAELQSAEKDPYITPETAQALEADLLAGMKEKETQTERKFVKLIDEFYPEISETREAVQAGNELLVKINLDMLKDPKKRELKARTGYPINITQYSGNLPCCHYADQLRCSDSYKENGGEKPINPQPDMIIR